MMTFMEAVESCLIRKFATFSGRASRSEYWWFTLFMVFAAMLFGAVFGVLYYAMLVSDYKALFAGMLVAWVLLFFAAAFIPSLAVTVRRLHDTGRTGWWYLANFIPYVGSFVLLYFMVLPSEHNENEYGPEGE